MPFLRRHRFAVELALLALVAYLGAFGVSVAVRSRFTEVPPAPAEAAVEPPAPAPAPLAAYAVIAERDVFNPGGAAGARARASGRDASGLRLWGVAFSGDEARAVIEDPATRRQELYRVGDRIGDARVATIGWDRVSLEGPAGEQTLELTTPGSSGPPPPPAAPAAPPPAPDGERIRQTAENVFIVDRRELAGAVDSMSALLTQLRAVAEVRDGRPAGLRLFQIRDGSLFARLGLRNGDVVQRVNGSAVADPATLLGFLTRLGHEPRVALDIVRADAPRTLVYDLR
jgi:general secretion pathway protein C